MKKQIAIGGMIAGGFDATGKFLLTVSHAGRRVFDTASWQRVARDPEPIFPENGRILGIGPIAESSILIHEIDYDTEILEFRSPDRNILLQYSEGTLTITSETE